MHTLCIQVAEKEAFGGWNFYFIIFPVSNLGPLALNFIVYILRTFK